jgi:hypothetical protein
MNKNLRATSLGVLVASLGLLAVSSFPVSSQVPPSRTTLTFFDPIKTDFGKFINEGRRGFSPGDEFLFIENLKDPETCEGAGRIIGKFTVSKLVGQENSFVLADFGFRLADGTITGYHAGKFTDFESATRNHLAVTGGTQIYRDASGEFTIDTGQQMCDSKGDIITVDLLLP